MNKSSEMFAKLLTEAVYRIRTLENKSVQIVQDELGYALGKKGGSSVEYWRKGRTPSKTADVELLAAEIVRRSDVDKVWLTHFLDSAGYYKTAVFVAAHFPDDEQEKTAVSPTPTPVVHDNLPPQPTTFIGREQELQYIQEQLADPACRLLTLTGPGGIGKTRLALQAALQIKETHQKTAETEQLFLNGACFVSLDALSSGDFLAATIANALNFSFFSGDNQDDQLLSYLHDKRLLLLIDNVEHLIQEATLLADILAHAPHVQIIATSRERLNLRGEWVMELRGLLYPQTAVFPETVASPIAPETYDAVQLFLHNARRLQSSFAPDADALKHIVAICRLVGGTPLAIELAATWTRLLSCAEIEQEIEQGYGFLETSLRDVPERHRSLQAVFEYSWNLLSKREQTAVSKLAVFQGGFRRQAASSVAGASLPLLSALMDKSFLFIQPTRQGQTTARYEMHGLLRQYALEKLGEKTAVYNQTHADHCHHFANFTDEHASHLRGGEQTKTLKEIGDEIDNLRAGWRYAVTNTDAKSIAAYLDGLFLFYDIRSWVQEGEEVLGTAVVALQSQPPSRDTTLLIGKLLSRQSKFRHRLGGYIVAQHLLEQSLLIFDDYQADKERAHALNLRGNVAYRLGEHDEAVNLCKESLALSQRHHYQWQMAESLKTLGDLAEIRGDYSDAQQLHEEGLTLSQTLNDRRGIAYSLNRLGYVAWHLGEYDEAERRCNESLTLCREVGDQRGISMSFKNLGNVACDLGQYDKANRHYRTGLKISEEIGDRWGSAVFDNNLGNVAWETGHYQEAKTLCSRSLAVWRNMGYQVGMASSLETLGAVAEALGQIHEARAYFLEGLQIALDIQAIPLALHVLTGLALLLTEEKEWARAVEMLTFILEHPAIDQEAKEKIHRRLPLLTIHLSPRELQAAQEQGRREGFDDIVQRVYLFE